MKMADNLPRMTKPADLDADRREAFSLRGAGSARGGALGAPLVPVGGRSMRLSAGGRLGICREKDYIGSQEWDAGFPRRPLSEIKN